MPNNAALAEILYFRSKGVVIKLKRFLTKPLGLLLLASALGMFYDTNFNDPKAREPFTSASAEFLTVMWLIPTLFLAPFFVSRRGLHFDTAEEHFVLQGPYSRLQVVAYALVRNFLISFGLCIPAIAITRLFHFWELIGQGLFAFYFFSTIHGFTGPIFQRISSRSFLMVRVILAVPAILTVSGLALAAIMRLKGHNIKEFSASTTFQTAKDIFKTLELLTLAFLTRPIGATSVLLVGSIINSGTALLFLNPLSDASHETMEKSRQSRETNKQNQSANFLILKFRKSLLPSFAFMNGLGPLCWLRLTEASRSFAYFLLLSSFGFFCESAVFIVLSQSNLIGKATLPGFFPTVSVCLAAYYSVPDFIFLKFRLGAFKSLPISPRIILFSRMLVPLICVVAISIGGAIAARLFYWFTHDNRVIIGHLLEVALISTAINAMAVTLIFFFLLYGAWAFQKATGAPALKKKAQWLSSLILVPVVGLLLWTLASFMIDYAELTSPTSVGVASLIFFAIAAAFFQLGAFVLEKLDVVGLG